MFAAIKQGAASLAASEKAIAAGLLVIAATIFVIIGKISFQEWQTYTTWCLGIYVGGKTVHGTATVIAGAMKPTEPAEKG